MKKLLIYILLMPLLMACSQDDIPASTADSDIIQLTASVASIKDMANTRAAKDTTYVESTPSTSAPLSADVWLSTTEGTYKGTTYGTTGYEGSNIDAHRTITYTGDGATSPSANSNNEYLRYPSDGSTVYCVGLYPRDAWSTTDGTTVTATIDCQNNPLRDLMFAPQIEGSVGNMYTTSGAKQQFSHLLTWLKVRVRAEDDVAVSTWGKLKSITLDSQDQVSINLSTGTSTFSQSVTDYKAPLFSSSAGDELTITSVEKSSVLVAPVTADAGTDDEDKPKTEFTLHVTCENHNSDVAVNLLDNNGDAYSGSTAGKLFVITLYFTPLKYITGSITLEDWDDEYRNLIMN